MAIPILPIAAIAAAVLFLGGKKGGKKKSNGDNGVTPTGTTISVTTQELQTMGEIPMSIGDTLKVTMPHIEPYQSVLATEVVAGAPFIDVKEKQIPFGAMGATEFAIKAIQGVGAQAPSEGKIKADFIHETPPGSDDPAQVIATVMLLVTAP
jgi:hypothetical protein